VYPARTLPSICHPLRSLLGEFLPFKVGVVTSGSTSESKLEPSSSLVAQNFPNSGSTPCRVGLGRFPKAATEF
jgi:hypothetical protein